MTRRSVRSVTRLGLLCAAAVILYVLESLAPRPLPWMRLGLGNLPVLVTLLGHGFGSALTVSLLKLFLGGLLSGGLGGPGTLIGLAAGVSSLAAMAAIRSALPGLFSPIGLSVVGAVVHQLCQLGVAALYIGSPAVWGLLPLSLLSGIVSGTLIGCLALWCHLRLYCVPS
jgi:heptaprenyl diphosphate synthase